MRDEVAEERAMAYSDWQKEYRPVVYVEYSAENLKKMQHQNPKYVWTDHDTCENSSVTAGFNFFGDPPRCCWVTHGWHITEVAHSGDSYESFDTSAYLPCPVCNMDGDGEGADDCPGPEPIDGAETSDGCEDGWVQWYFD